MQYAELFGKPVLTTTGTIPRETVPDGWSCYDMQATGRNSDTRTALVSNAAFGHRGTVLSPTPLKRPSTAARRIGAEGYILHGEKMDLEVFCVEHKLDYPDNPIKFEIRPAFLDEAVFLPCCLMRTHGWGHRTRPHQLRAQQRQVLAHLVAQRSRGVELPGVQRRVGTSSEPAAPGCAEGSDQYAPMVLWSRRGDRRLG